ncbi:ArsR/SmtB family transcription factor [Nocardioides jensenii]|uniref:ArsR/SmtB family transcription factor n=1 Tax=Nocardioides jensenii TaxID=1843 RepID=UPI00082D7257|nr:helix-turn-helix domain-containing protein [Nocardioides jensenii]
MSNEPTPVSALRAVAHPLRLQILSLLTGAEMSAAEVARELAVTHANASYHLRVLLDAGELVVAGEEKIRGGIAKRYRHPWEQQQAPPAPATDEDHRLYIRAVAEELVRRFDQRRRASKALLSDAEMWVDPETWQQVLELTQEAARLIHDSAQPPRTDGTVHVNLTTLAFEMTEPR